MPNEALLASDPKSQARRLKLLMQYETLPDFAVLYFDHLRARARRGGVSADGVVEPLPTLPDRSHTWHDLYRLERELKCALSPEEINRELWSLRARYREIVGLAEYEAYLASKPPSLDEKVTATDDALRALKADMEFLLSEIYIGYALAQRRQDARKRVSNYVAVASSVGLVIAVVIAVWVAMADPNELRTGASIIPAMFVGAMGALFSMQRRFQSIPNEGDPIYSTVHLHRGRLDILVTASIGALSAAVLFLAFSGALLEGALFPKMVATVGAAKPDAKLGFFQFMRMAGPSDLPGYGKLLVWSFIAGFAERLVPDTLSRFAERGSATKEVRP